MSRNRHSENAPIGSLWEELAEYAVADVVVVDADAPDLLPTYTYRIPEALQKRVSVGVCVHVPFGGQEKVGYILDIRRMATSDPFAARLRDLIGPVQGALTFNREQAAIARWIAARYVCDLSSAVRGVAPSSMNVRVVTVVRLASDNLTAASAGNALIQAHIIETLRSLGGTAELETLRSAARVSAFNSAYGALKRKGLLLETREVLRARTVGRMARAYELGGAAGTLIGRLSPAGQRILDALTEFTRNGETPVLPEKLLTAAQASPASLKTLVEKGIVLIREVEIRRAPHSVPAQRTQPPPFSAGQRAAAEHIACMIASGSREEGEGREGRVALLFGVTASGKTEVYLDAISRTLCANRCAIVLVPEIALTAQVVEVFTGRFGDEVAVLHSALSEGERHDEWRRLQEGKARIVVGARSAVFAPLENVGLIVIDEEHEASYKQETTPRYHARDVALERACLTDAAVVLGSATPSVETYFAAEQGTIARLQMPERIDNRPLPDVHVVDLREEWKQSRALFSRPLLEAMGERLARGQQTILFLNRRGYAQFILCRDCGYVARCPNCAVSLTFHASINALRCHHCDYGCRAPQICPQCGGTKIRAFGIGTEKVEEEALKHFPKARIVRLDRDTTTRKGAHAAILRRFRSGEADILIGTQMVAKGLDFPNVTLVGVISADTAINVPDFRASERTFQLLTQVAGRAGRGDHPGTVIIQTFSPDHYSIQRAMRQDYPGFYAEEIAFREELRYPPFSRFANLISVDENHDAARDRARLLSEAFQKTLPSDVELIGPAPAPLSRLKGLFRWHVVLRAPTDAPLSDYIRTALSQLSTSQRIGLTVDVDPISVA